MDLYIDNKNGAILNTKNKYCPEDINVKIKTQKLKVKATAEPQSFEGMFGQVDIEAGHSVYFDSETIISEVEPVDEYRKKLWIKKIDDSNNMVDISSLKAGWVQTDGTFGGEPTSGEMYSDYIEVEPSTTYLFEIVKTTDTYQDWFGIGEYKEDQTFIKRQAFTNFVTKSIKFTTSSTTKYIVVSARNLSGASAIRLKPFTDEGIFTLNSEGIYDKLDLVGATEGWQTLSSTHSVSYKKTGIFVEIRVAFNSGSGNTLAKGITEIGTLPEDCRPTMSFGTPVFTITTSNGFSNNVVLLVNTDGTVQFQNYTSSVKLQAIFGQVSFLL